MAQRFRLPVALVIVVILLAAVVVGARLLGSRGASRDAARAAEIERANGVVNHLQIVNMLDVPIRISIRDVEPSQWGRTPPDDEPPAGLEAEVIAPLRVGGSVGLRPLRIVDGGGDATFTVAVLAEDREQSRTLYGTIPTRSTTIEYCGNDGRCFDGYGYYDWADAPEPRLDVFRTCVVEDRVIGRYVDSTGRVGDLYAAFQCDATKFRSSVVIHA
jgi:hypothetical protein